MSVRPRKVQHVFVLLDTPSAEVRTMRSCGVMITRHNLAELSRILKRQCNNDQSKEYLARKGNDTGF
jgi:hypothetical protein